MHFYILYILKGIGESPVPQATRFSLRNGSIYETPQINLVRSNNSNFNTAVFRRKQILGYAVY